ncbi:hypothetical protein TGP89_288455B, partial [Toxoplasma gondii p89]
HRRDEKAKRVKERRVTHRVTAPSACSCGENPAKQTRCSLLLLLGFAALHTGTLFL